jgi:hypothetical protein
MIAAAYVFTQRFELVLCQEFAALDLLYPLVKLNHALCAAAVLFCLGRGLCCTATSRHQDVWIGHN